MMIADWLGSFPTVFVCSALFGESFFFGDVFFANLFAISADHARFEGVWAPILCNLIWSLNPVWAKVALDDVRPLELAWYRYLFTLITLVAFRRILKRVKSPIESNAHSVSFFKPELLAMGALTFCISPALQFWGLGMSRAVDNALIIATEPMMTVVLAAVFLGERLKPYHWLLFPLSLLGFAWLSDLNFSEGIHGHTLGNLLMMLSLVGEGAYSVIGKKLLKNFDASEIFERGLWWGVGFLTLLMLWINGIPKLPQLNTWGAILWLGPFATTGGYLYWLHAMKRFSLTSLSLTLFMQPLGGAAFAVLFRGESLTVKQLSGGALILGAILIQNVIETRMSATKTP